jgi:hypothetical protein
MSGFTSQGNLPYQQTDPCAPAIVEELLEADGEWKEQADIIKLTFKSICHVLKAQNEAIKEFKFSERMMYGEGKGSAVKL